MNASKRYINVTLDDFTLIRVPDPVGFSEMVVAEFNQHYSSDSYADISRKRLYLVRDTKGGAWRILLEQGVDK